MSEDEFGSERALFREHAHAKNAILASDRPSAARANQHVDAMDALVDAWAKKDPDRVKDILAPLLDDSEAAIRCAAASYLLYHGTPERACAVLAELANDDNYGFASSSAETALMVWEARQRQGGR